jgi:phospholipid/cholesterol/gamma-HCH transport system permease protein
MIKKLIAYIGHLFIVICECTGSGTLFAYDSIKNLTQGDKKETIRQMAKLGVDSLPIVFLTIFFSGMVFSAQSASEFVKFGAGSTVGGVVAIAMGRELVPILTGVVVAGRIGAAIAAEIGTMNVTEQIDALRVMAVNPIRYLVVPRLWALMLTMPIIVLFANIVGDLGGLFAATSYTDLASEQFIRSITVYTEVFDITGGMIKSVFFGAIIALVACYKGLHTRQGAEGVGLSTTASVVFSMVLIFAANYFLSLVLYVY